MRFSTATVIGTGMMGPGIAATLALYGVKATVLSRTRESAEAGAQKAREQARLLQEHGLAPAGEVAISGSADFAASIAGVDLVIESAPEDMAFKQDLFARLDEMANPDAVLASNTSGLSITEIASKCTRPERVMTTHFWNPPHLMPLVEIVKGERTSPALAEEMRTFLAACGKVAVMVKRDTPGQLGNRLQIALQRECLHILREGIADVEDIDLAIKNGFGLRLPEYGAFEHLDMVGLDMGGDIIAYISQDLSNLRGLPAEIAEKRERGELGAKAGRGFYDWSQRDAAAVRARRDAHVLAMLKRRKGLTP
jgi:3-hydroxybutyryl-CoA dehydrogenase